MLSPFYTRSRLRKATKQQQQNVLKARWRPVLSAGPNGCLESGIEQENKMTRLLGIAAVLPHHVCVQWYSLPDTYTLILKKQRLSLLQMRKMRNRNSKPNENRMPTVSGTTAGTFLQANPHEMRFHAVLAAVQANTKHLLDGFERTQTRRNYACSTFSVH